MLEIAIMLALTASPPTTHGCLSGLVCELQPRISRKKWSPERCDQMVSQVLQRSLDAGISPYIVLATMLVESDLSENAFKNAIASNGRPAKDSGLMAIRCVLSDDGKTCTNGIVRGVRWTKLMEPDTNILAGIQILASYKNGRCKHKDHAYWAHYAHGIRYIKKGQAALYPYNVAVVAKALINAIGEPIPTELMGPITVGNTSIGPPIGRRYRELVAKIDSRKSCRLLAKN